MENTFLIGICGRSCCGKDSIAQRIASVNPHVLHINGDMFFEPKSDCMVRIKGKIRECWEHKDVIRWKHLREVVRALKNGSGVTIQDRSLWWGAYDCEICPDDLFEYNIILIQGYLLFIDKAIADLFDTRIFIEVNDENILYRRLCRDNSIKGIHYIHAAVIPASKEYEAEQRATSKIFDSNINSISALTDDVIKYINLQLYTSKFEDNLVIPNKKDVSFWQVYPGDLLSDHEWHPVDFADLKDHVQNQKQALDTGHRIDGNTFQYRRNPNTGNYEVRLSHDGDKYRHLFRYTREPTLPKQRLR